MRRIKSEHGFTLVELMITVVIVGILASVAIPLYTGNIKRAKAAEADAALGSIRTALRVYYAENSAYPTEASYVAVTTLSIDVDSTDLIGTYFAATTYTYQSAAGTSFTLRATGTGSQSGINRQLTSAGVLSSFSTD